MNDLERRIKRLQSILDVAKAMTATRELDALLAIIMEEAAKVVEADRCSLFLVDRDRAELWSKIAQKATSEIRFPLGLGIAGAVAQTGELVNITDAYQDPRFNRAIDMATGYKTSTILCVPMRNTALEVVGVIQALNSKNGKFSSEDEELLVAMGGQAAPAIENAVLHQEIERLFDGFVNASVLAIEARDPTTAGHSERVAKLTVGLARAVDRGGEGPYKELHFRHEELRQLRYAALLHDFGKVGVREHVLVKANKLYPHELELVKGRFEVIRAHLEVEKMRAIMEQRPTEEFDRRAAELEGMLEFVLNCNRPTVLAEGGFERLSDIAANAFANWRGEKLPYLSANEIACLSIPRGSLSTEERREIESHVSHTYRFLSQIPWTRDLKRIPEIAFAHHEKLNGKGYPRAISAQLIPAESRMMAIADIYDALTASDRPYKKALTPEKALDILRFEAKHGQVDNDLLDIFIGGEVFKEIHARAA
jgi:HD-GYP domain-containing protein (c-di-GMP phosphodiesterase class II)